MNIVIAYIPYCSVLNIHIKQLRFESREMILIRILEEAVAIWRRPVAQASVCPFNECVAANTTVTSHGCDSVFCSLRTILVM